MVQTMFDRPRRMRVTRDYGAMAGASGAHHVRAENGNEYIVKGLSLAPTEPYAAANEYLAATLGQALGLPLLEFTLVEMAGEPLFASAWMRDGSFDLGVSETTFAQCENKTRVYDLVVFDAWLCNEDRHELNLIVRRQPREDGTDALSLVFNDHSRCLLPPPTAPDGLTARWHGTPIDQFIRLPFVRQGITDRHALDQAISAIEAFGDDSIRTCVRMTPEEFLQPAERKCVEDFLVARRDELRNIFNSNAANFAALQGAQL